MGCLFAKVVNGQGASIITSKNNGALPMTTERLDTVGYWTEIKLQILQDYAKAYAQVLQNQIGRAHV